MTKIEEEETIEQRYAPIKEEADNLIWHDQFVEWEYGDDDIVDYYKELVYTVFNREPQTHNEVDIYLSYLKEARAILDEVKNRWN